MERNNTEVLVSKCFLTDQQICIGINSNGNFIASFNDRNFRVIDDKNIVYLLRLCEIEYFLFYDKIQSLVDEFNSLNLSNKADISKFPFSEVVEKALTSERDYWVELSIPWIIAMNKNTFNHLIKKLAGDKRISQKLRHRLLKL